MGRSMLPPGWRPCASPAPRNQLAAGAEHAPPLSVPRPPTRSATWVRGPTTTTAPSSSTTPPSPRLRPCPPLTPPTRTAALRRSALLRPRAAEERATGRPNTAAGLRAHSPPSPTRSPFLTAFKVAIRACTSKAFKVAIRTFTPRLPLLPRALSSNQPPAPLPRWDSAAARRPLLTHLFPCHCLHQFFARNSFY